MNLRRLALPILALTLASPFAAAHDGDRPPRPRQERRVELRERILRHRARVRIELRQRVRAELREMRREHRRLATRELAKLRIERALERARNVR